MTMPRPLHVPRRDNNVCLFASANTSGARASRQWRSGRPARHLFQTEFIQRQPVASDCCQRLVATVELALTSGCERQLGKRARHWRLEYGVQQLEESVFAVVRQFVDLLTKPAQWRRLQRENWMRHKPNLPKGGCDTSPAATLFQ